MRSRSKKCCRLAGPARRRRERSTRRQSHGELHRPPGRVRPSGQGVPDRHVALHRRCRAGSERGGRDEHGGAPRSVTGGARCVRCQPARRGESCRSLIVRREGRRRPAGRALGVCGGQRREGRVAAGIPPRGSARDAHGSNCGRRIRRSRAPIESIKPPMSCAVARLRTVSIG